jgi:hypothetical protein
MDKTNAEPQRRYIERLKERAASATEIAALQSEIAVLNPKSA